MGARGEQDHYSSQAITAGGPVGDVGVDARYYGFLNRSERQFLAAGEFEVINAESESWKPLCGSQARP